MEECSHMGSDGHSHSWSTPLEFMEAYVHAVRAWEPESALDKYLQVRLKEGALKAVQEFMQDFCSLDTYGLEHRFVYWFDN
jgi:hypothetical protein